MRNAASTPTSEVRTRYEELFLAQAPGLWRSAYLLLHDADAADDALQEAYLRGVEHLPDRSSKVDPPWMARLVIEACRGGELRGPRGTDEAPAREAGATGPLSSMIRRERNWRLALAMGYLEPRAREAFVLRYVEGMDEEEAARALDLTAAEVRELARAGRRTLRRRLEGASTVLPGRDDTEPEEPDA